MNAASSDKQMLEALRKLNDRELPTWTLKVVAIALRSRLHSTGQAIEEHAAARRLFDDQ